MKKSQTETRSQVERALAEYPVMITREQLAKFLNLSCRTLGNYDGKSIGPCNPLRIGRKVLYEKSSVLDWLVARAEHQESKR